MATRRRVATRALTELRAGAAPRDVQKMLDRALAGKRIERERPAGGLAPKKTVAKALERKRERRLRRGVR